MTKAKFVMGKVETTIDGKMFVKIPKGCLFKSGDYVLIELSKGEWKMKNMQTIDLILGTVFGLIFFGFVGMILGAILGFAFGSFKNQGLIGNWINK